MKRFLASSFFAFGCAATSTPPAVTSGTDCPATPNIAGPVDLIAATPEPALPNIPDELRRKVTPFLAIRGAEFESLSPSGKEMLITTRFAETAQVHRVAEPFGARTQLTYGDEPVRSPRFVPGEPGRFSFLRDVGGDEQFQIFLTQTTHSAEMRVTDGRSRNDSQLWSDDGTALAFSSTLRNGKDSDVYVWKKGDTAPVSVFQGPGTYVPLDWARDGAHLLVLRFVSIAETELHVVDLKAQTSKAITPPSPPAAYLASAFGSHHEQIYVTSDRDGDFHQLFSLNTANGKWKSLSAGIPWNIEDVAVSSDGRLIAFAVNERGVSAIYLMNAANPRPKRVPGLPAGVVQGLEFARNAPILGFTLSQPTQPDDAFTYDLRQQNLRQWTASEAGGIDPSTLVPPTLMEYPTFDGHPIPALIYRPETPGPHPVMINFHGGPEAQSRPYFDALAQYLTSRLGVVVILPNVRGSQGYGKAYLTLDNGMLRHDAVRDAGALLDWIATQPDLDAKRVAVYGGSYGGFMALAALVGFPERIAAGVEVVGISNFVTFLENTSEYRRDQRRAEYGDERQPEMRRYLESISPLNHVARIQAPLFVAQGANDPRVPRSEAEQIVQAVRSGGHDVRYFLATDEGHGFRKRANRDQFVLQTIQFLSEHLKLTPE